MNIYKYLHNQNNNNDWDNELGGNTIAGTQRNRPEIEAKETSNSFVSIESQRNNLLLIYESFRQRDIIVLLSATPNWMELNWIEWLNG